MSLGPESEQIREVYAYYGLAMYWAQCLEQSIFQHLMFFDHFPTAVAGYTTPERWAADFDRYEERELGQTMGKLIRRLQQVGRPTDGIEGSLAVVLKTRNWLAHGYFADRAVEFMNQTGREKMLEELESAKGDFERCAAELDAVSLPAARALGFTDEMLAKIESDMVAAYASRTEA